MIEAVFFDNDGVLVSTEHLVFEANKEVFESLGVEYSLEDFKYSTLCTNQGSAGFLASKNFDAQFISEFNELRKPIWYKKLDAKNHSIAGVEKTLDALNEYQLAITTSAHQDVFKRSHAYSNLLQYFDFILTREDYKNIKPAPDVYLKAIEQSGIPIESILVVEDAPRGVKSAKSSGLTVVAIPHELTVGLDFSEADFVLTSIRELPQLIDEINK